MFGIRATFHTTTKASPMQLVYNRDAILNIKYHADWKFIKDRKQKLIEANNRRENSKRIEHDYQVNDLVLLTKEKTSKHGEPEYEGPYQILEVNKENGTARIQKERYSDNVNIRILIPYTA